MHNVEAPFARPADQPQILFLALLVVLFALVGCDDPGVEVELVNKTGSHLADVRVHLKDDERQLGELLDGAAICIRFTEVGTDAVITVHATTTAGTRFKRTVGYVDTLTQHARVELVGQGESMRASFSSD